MMSLGSTASISVGSPLVVGGSYDCNVRMWNLNTSELVLVAGPFKSDALRYSEDSRKLAILSQLEKFRLDICLPVDLLSVLYPLDRMTVLRMRA
jgi:WD40 repeat protein